MKFDTPESKFQLKVFPSAADQATGDMRLPITTSIAFPGGTRGRTAGIWAGMLGLYAAVLAGGLWAQPTPPVGGQQVVVKGGDPRVVFYVDGAEYRGSASFFWPLGSKHILSVPVRMIDSDNGQGRCQYSVPDFATRFCDFNWREKTGLLQASQDRYQTITVGPDTSSYELQYQTEHKITLIFANSYSGNTQIPENGIACGAPGTPVGSAFRVGAVVIGGNCYLSNASFWQAAGAVTLNAYPFPGFVFLGWSVNRAPGNYLGNIEVNQPISLVPRFTPAKRLAMRTIPEELKVRVDRVETGTPGTDAPCAFWGEQVPYTNPTIPPLCIGEYDLAPDSRHIIGAPSPQMDRRGKIWVLDKFSNGETSDFIYQVGAITTNNQFETITALFVPGVSTSITTKPAGLKVVIDGRDNWPANYFVFAAGKKIVVSAPAEQTDARGRRYLFKGWSNGGEATQELTVPDQASGLAFSIVAEYELLSQLTIKSNPYGAPVTVDGASCDTPCTIDRREGTAVSIAAPASHMLSEAHRFQFAGWADGADRERAFTLSGVETQTLTANFSTAYRLRIATDPEGAARILTEPASTDGFFTGGTFVTVTAKAGPGYKFRRWSGDLSGAFTSATVTVSGARSAVASFDKVPYIPETGVRNAAAEIPSNTVAPGSLVSILGENLAADYVAGPSNPLSQSVGDVSVVAANRILPLVFVSPQQINAQLPLDLEPGEYELTVKRVGAADVTGKFTVSAVAPGLFHKMVESNAWAMASRADGTAVDGDHPALPGETILLTGTGFGRYQPNMLDGFAFPPVPEFQVAAPVELWSGETAIAVKSAAGIAGQVGTVGVRFVVPAGTPAGPWPLTVKMEGVSSNTVLVPVAAPPAQ